MPISNDEAVKLILRINEGYCPTEKEQRLLSKLQYLDLRRTQVSSFDGLSGLNNLQFLDLSGTQVTSLAGLNGLNKLQELYLSGTQVSSLDGLSGLNKLQKLYLGSAQVSSLDGLSELNNLQELDLSGTQVSSLEGLSGLNNLQKLDLSGTQVSSLDGLSGLNNLQTLWLNDTQVNSLEGLSGLHNLQKLDLSRTQVSSLDGLSGLHNLQTLDLSRTQVSSLNGLSGLNNLQTLALRGTQVSSLDCLSGLNNLQELYLSGTQVSSLEGLSGLHNLQKLDLRGTQVSSLDGLSGLNNLQTLWLNDTQVNSLDGLSGLNNLQKLWLNDTQVNSLDGFSGLHNLQKLDLRGTQVRSLEGLSGLNNLQILDLRGTHVSSLVGLSGSHNLQTLDLSGTKVSSLDGLSELNNLQTLDLSETIVSSLEELKSLERLTRLYISGTLIDHIPKWLVDRNLPFKMNRYWGIEPGVYMKDVELFEQPVCLFSQSRELIEAYYKEEQAPVNEAKVIFLGDGGVGKTYTIYRIEHDGEAPANTETTPGVSITQYKRDGKATINFWDFGGQEIMHSMHRCFLTERTCYVIMVSNRWSEVTRQARRWLKNVESFAPNSKVVIAVNQWEGVSTWDLDRKRLKEEFPNLVDVVEYTATDSAEIGKLSRRIEKEVDELTSVKMKLPKSWAEIMVMLRNMPNESGEPRNYITNAEYQDICRNTKLQAVGDISTWLLEWFNDLGVCFSFHRDSETKEALKEYKVLNPLWLTNAVYIIVNDGRTHAQNGSINHASLKQILQEPKTCVDKSLKYRGDELNFILEVMRKFRLSFKIGDDREFVPALCKNETPENLRPTESVSHVRCEVRYDYLPDSVVHRLMVDNAKILDVDKCWLKGLCIDLFDVDGLFAVCDMGKDDDVLYIDVYQLVDVDNITQRSPQSLLHVLLNKIEKINDELNLKSETWICSVDGKAAFRLSYLLDAVQKKKRVVQNSNSDEYIEYDVQELLGQVFDKPIQIDLSTLKEREREQIFSEDRLLFLKRYIKEGCNIELNIFINNSTPSKKEFEQFRDELKKLVELNEDQKFLLCDAIGKLIDKLEAPKKEFQKQGETFKRTVNGLNVAKSVLAVAAQFSVIGNFLRSFGIFK